MSNATATSPLAHTVESLAPFWQQSGLEHILPVSGKEGEFPEGFDVCGMLKGQLDANWKVVDVGCGAGRLNGAFTPANYIGVDINPAAIRAASLRFPQCQFKTITPWEPLPKTDLAFAYMTILHIPDMDLARFLSWMAAGSEWVMIAELMDRRWRQDGMPPVFAREPEEYVSQMASMGYALRRMMKLPYKHFDRSPYHINHDIRVAFHLYERVARG